QFVSNLAAESRTVLFVGTKRQAQDAIAEEAQRSGMFFVNQRWLGGLLTNFSTIQRSLARLRDLEAMETDGRYESLSKKEIAQIADAIDAGRGIADANRGADEIEGDDRGRRSRPNRPAPRAEASPASV